MSAEPLTPVRSSAGRQLVLLMLALGLFVAAYILVTLGTSGHTPPGIAGFVVVVAGAYVVAHAIVVRTARGADPAFLPAVAVLTGIGYAEIYRLAPDLAEEQFVWLLLGLALFAVTLVAVRDHRILESYTYTIGLVGVGCLLLPALPGLGATINGARLWIHLGPLSFQPAEIGKVLIVIFLASYLNAKKELLATATRRVGPVRFPEPRYLGPLLLAWAVSLAVLFLEKDLGSSLLFFGIFIVMLWVATGRGAYLVLGVILFAVGAYIGYRAFPHVRVRMDVWLRALEPGFVRGDGYQLAQGEFAMASGGLTGVGFGLGYPFKIPYAPTDLIFAALGEEMGLAGVTAILLCYAVLIGRGFRAALASEDGFSKLLAVGLTTTIALQTFIIVGGVTRLIPLTGITLPFVSYGGSSLVANFVVLALLVRISASERAGPVAT